MASSMGCALQRIKQELDQWIDESTMHQACRAAGHCWRRRVLTPLDSVHLMLLQLLAQVALAGLRHATTVSAQGISQARQRLPLDVLLKLLELSCSAACAKARGQPSDGEREADERVITTLVDPQTHPAQAIAELYERRWQVEVCFRDLKCTLKMKRLRSRTIAGVRKETVAFVLLYNLVRQVMLRAASEQKVEPHRISFIDAARWLLWSDPNEPLSKLVVNRSRRRPAEPRVLKHGRHKYPLMKQPRAVLRERLMQSGRVRG